MRGDDLIARLRANPLTPADQLRRFMHLVVAESGGPDETGRWLRRYAAESPVWLDSVADAIEALLASFPKEGALAQMVRDGGNLVLPDETNKAVSAWLHGLAQQIRDVRAAPRAG